MKRKVEINGKTLQLELNVNANEVTAVIDGRNYQLTLINPEDNIYTVLVNNHVYEFSAVAGNEADTLTINSAKKAYPVRIIDQKKASTKHAVSATGLQKIISPMPGRIVQILKSPNDAVVVGEGVVVVEAMKMQNELTSPKNGIIKEIKVAIGQTVAANEVLVIIE